MAITDHFKVLHRKCLAKGGRGKKGKTKEQFKKKKKRILQSFYILVNGVMIQSFASQL